MKYAGYKKTMKKLLLIGLLAASPILAAAEYTYRITAEEWSRPRSGEQLVTLPGLGNAVRRFMEMPEGFFIIRYPGGEEGSLWAGELQAWLVAMGIESSLIEMRPGSDRDDLVELIVTTKHPQRP